MIKTPNLSNVEHKNSIIDMLSPFEFCYGRYLLNISSIKTNRWNTWKEEISNIIEKEKEKGKDNNNNNIIDENNNILQIESNKTETNNKIKYNILKDDIRKKLPVIRDDIRNDIHNL
jgi:hypothetical protein